MRRFAFVAIVLLTVGCQKTLVEELPTGSTSISPVSVPGSIANAPIVVVPVPLPVPSSGGTAPADGGGSSTPSTTPPTSSTPPPSSGGSGGSSVVKVGAKVFFVECEGQLVPGSEHASEAPVGCRVHLDATPKDASNQPTQAKGSPNWTYSDLSLASASSKAGDYTPTLGVNAPGNFSCYVTVDGVQSNTVNIRFVN